MFVTSRNSSPDDGALRSARNKLDSNTIGASPTASARLDQTAQRERAYADANSRNSILLGVAAVGAGALGAGRLATALGVAASGAAAAAQVHSERAARAEKQAAEARENERKDAERAATQKAAAERAAAEAKAGNARQAESDRAIRDFKANIGNMKGETYGGRASSHNPGRSEMIKRAC